MANNPQSLRAKYRHRKSPALYLIILGLWAPLFAAACYSTMPVVRGAFTHSEFIGWTVVVTMGFIAYFWLNGTKDVAYTLFYHLWFKSRHSLPEIGLWRRLFLRVPRVVWVYCTYNDFNAESLLASMQQDYPNFEVVILDDSNKQEYINRVAAFGRKHKIRVIRRPDNAGFKAGNLNHGLAAVDRPVIDGDVVAAQLSGAKIPWDYFGILDSDEIIPRSFTNRCLDYFARSKNVGIVQANHKATRNRNNFMRQFAPGVDSHWPTYQAVKDRYGFMSLLGHGAMVSRECFNAAGGFPHVVAEDICFSIAARRAGYLTVFAPDIMCEEEFPVDYTSFRTRHGKWTGGNMEFIRKNTVKILFGRGLHWFERLDIVLFTYSLPLTALFSVYVIINIFVFPMNDYTLQYPVWMLIPTVIFLLAPMLNDIIHYWNKMKKGELLAYLFHSTLLFGSMYFVSLRSSIMTMFGGAVFTVTPKDSNELTLREAFWYTKAEWFFGMALAGLTIGLNQSILPVILLVVPALFAVALAVGHVEPRPKSKRRRHRLAS